MSTVYGGLVRSTIIDSDGNVVKVVRKPAKFLGSEGTGTNPNKVFTIVETSDLEIKEVFVSKSFLVPITDYAFDDDAKTVTMNGVFVGDTVSVIVFYDV